MTATKRLPRLAKLLGLKRSWLAAAALLALTPKCLLCLAAYAGLGTILIGGPELCSGVTTSGASWTIWFAAVGAACGVIGLLSVRGRQRRPGPQSEAPEALLQGPKSIDAAKPGAADATGHLIYP